MKTNIHPELNEITIVMTDGEERKILSTYGKAGDKLTLDVDPKNHPAWTGQQRILEKDGEAERFKSRYGNIGF